MQEVISYTPQLTIKNTAMLAPGLGLNFLACIRSHIAGEYIAKRWYRNFPEDEQVVIIFNNANPAHIQFPRHTRPMKASGEVSNG
jgi:hypothetical protein